MLYMSFIFLLCKTLGPVETLLSFVHIKCFLYGKRYDIGNNFVVPPVTCQNKHLYMCLYLCFTSLSCKIYVVHIMYMFNDHMNNV